MTDLYDYRGREYSRVEGKGLADLGLELGSVFNAYPEYTDFEVMVVLFASDEFYHLHFVAQRYLALRGTGRLTPIV